MGLKCLLTHRCSLRDKRIYRAANGSAGAGVGAAQVRTFCWWQHHRRTRRVASTHHGRVQFRATILHAMAITLTY